MAAILILLACGCVENVEMSKFEEDYPTWK